MPKTMGASTYTFKNCWCSSTHSTHTNVNPRVYVLNCSTFYKNLNLHTFLVCISRCYHSSSEGGLDNFIAPKLIWCTWGWGLLLTNRQITDNHLKEPSVADPFFNATFSLLQYSNMSREGEHFHN